MVIFMMDNPLEKSKFENSPTLLGVVNDEVQNPERFGLSAFLRQTRLQYYHSRGDNENVNTSTVRDY